MNRWSQLTRTPREARLNGYPEEEFCGVSCISET